MADYQPTPDIPPPVDPLAAHNRRLVLSFWIIVGLPCAFLTPLVLTQAGAASIFWVPLLTGGTLATIGLISIACALGNQSGLVRVLSCWSIFVLGSSMFLSGAGTLHFFQMVSFLSYVAANAVAVFLGMQLPLWVVRYQLGQRIGLAHETQLQPRTRKFSIRFLLILTAVVAVVLTLLKGAHAIGMLSGTISEWLLLLVVIGGSTVLSAALCLPCVWLVLSQRKSIVTTAVWMLTAVWLVGPIVLTIVLLTFVGMRGSEAEILLFFYTFGFGAVGMTTCGLLISRSLGYCLLVPAGEGNLKVDRDQPPQRQRAVKLVEPIHITSASEDSSDGSSSH